MKLRRTIAKNLKLAMWESRMDGATLARKVGVTKAAVYAWLRGEAMTLDNLEAACRVLRVAPSTMVRPSTKKKRK